MGLDQFSSEGLTALKMNDVVRTDGKATKDNAFTQAGFPSLSKAFTINHNSPV